MDSQKALKYGLGFETVFLAGILLAIYSLPSGVAEAFKLFEFIGVVTAVMVTTGGLWWMREET